MIKNPRYNIINPDEPGIFPSSPRWANPATATNDLAKQGVQIVHFSEAKYTIITESGLDLVENLRRITF
jgi:hypothetical protein